MIKIFGSFLKKTNQVGIQLFFLQDKVIKINRKNSQLAVFQKKKNSQTLIPLGIVLPSHLEESPP